MVSRLGENDEKRDVLTEFGGGRGYKKKMQSRKIYLIGLWPS